MNVVACRSWLWLALLLACSSPCFAADNNAGLAGVVRDAHGVPQMGALVQLLSADAQVVAIAFTDNRGRYLIAAVLPGKYELRASAAFFMPATRENLRLRAGAQAVVNLTMSTLFEAEGWLPAQSRRADEPSDDWKWTLRSTASRPVLRLDTSTSDPVLVSSSAEGSRKADTETRVTVTNGDGDFGQGGVHQVLVIDRAMENLDGAILRTDIGQVSASNSSSPSGEIEAGYERRSSLGGNTRLLGGVQSHPEITGSGTNGAQVLRLASTQQIHLGDTVLIDAGSLVEAERLASTAFRRAPFLRIGVRVSPDVLIEYHFASARELQSSDDLDQLKSELSLLADANGHPLDTNGVHEELTVSRKLAHGIVQISAYTGHINHASVGGSGLLASADLGRAPVLADATTGTFRLASNTYTDRGLSLSGMQPLTPALSAWVSYDAGTALVRTFGPAGPLSTAVTDFRPERQQALSASLRGKIIRSGTSLRAEYRWQPSRSLTQVNSYNASENDAYLSFYLRQRVWCGHLLPGGFDLIIDATNLLEQGYQPVLGSDGTTLYLAQMPRAVRGGLAFNF